MKKIEKMIHQIIRFRGNIEAFLVSIEEFSRSRDKATQIRFMDLDTNWPILIKAIRLYQAKYVKDILFIIYFIF